MTAKKFRENREKLMKNVPNNSLVVLFAGIPLPKTADQFYPFLVNKNFYYLTGIDAPKVTLLMYKSNDKFTETIYVERTTELIRKWEGARLDKQEAYEISGIENQAYLDELDANLSKGFHGNTVLNLYLDLERRNIKHTINCAIPFAKELKDLYPYLNVQNIYADICELRVLKNEEEIKNMKKANEITKIALEKMMKHLKPNVNESEMEGLFDFDIKKNGSKRNSFNTIAAGGNNATTLHYEKNNMPLNDGELVLFDLGCEWMEYASDISRTYPINGKFTDRQKEIYNIVLSTQKEIIEMIKPGVIVADLHRKAKEILTKKCLDIGLIEKEEEVVKYYFHGIGHYIGLDVHDVGSYGEAMNRKLEVGMALTVEPGLYIPEENIGVRIEDDIVVTENGYENLSKDIIKEIDDIEKFMNA